MGINNLTGGKKAFVNFTESLLKEQIATLLPKENLVIEILENINPSFEIVEACRELKGRGYKLALDDFIYHDSYSELIEIADIIKIDFLNTDARQRELIFKSAREILQRFLFVIHIEDNEFFVIIYTLHIKMVRLRSYAASASICLIGNSRVNSQNSPR
jgi:c-di-GMP-related signal transduction protein